jgi:hypothetical protein
VFPNMHSPLVTCIYCSAHVDPSVGEGDHVMPAQLGEFRGDLRFRRICRRCNSEIGRAEQELMRSSPLGFYREIVRPPARRGMRPDGGRPAGRMSPWSRRTMLRRPDGTKFFVKPVGDDPRNVTAFDQLVIPDRDGIERYVELHPRMRLGQLKERIERIVGPGGSLGRAQVNWEDQHAEVYRGLLQKVYPGLEITGAGSLAPGREVLPGRTTFVFSDDYFRALAKIGFHHFLVRNWRGFRGDEPLFAAIRSFIRNGGSPDPFIADSGRYFDQPFGPRSGGGLYSPSRWMHIVAADEEADVIVAYVHLFLGPGATRPPVYITLGRVSEDDVNVLREGVWGSAFVYDNPPTDSGMAGDVRSFPTARFWRV